MTNTDSGITQLAQELSSSLGYTTPPCFLSPEELQKLGIAEINTLAVWRSSGRYNLPYVKMSRRVKYRLTDVVHFLMARTVTHTGQLES